MVASKETLLNHDDGSLDGGVTMLMIPEQFLFLIAISSPKAVKAQIIKRSEFFEFSLWSTRHCWKTTRVTKLLIL